LRATHFTEEQIIEILEQRKNGRTIAELAQEYKVSASTIYHWRDKYRNTKAHSHRVYHLEQENKRLHELVANLSVEKEMLKSILNRTGWRVSSETERAA
jgi:putative transposase